MNQHLHAKVKRFLLCLGHPPRLQDVIQCCAARDTQAMKAHSTLGLVPVNKLPQGINAPGRLLHQTDAWGWTKASNMHSKHMPNKLSSGELLEAPILADFSTSGFMKSAMPRLPADSVTLLSLGPTHCCCMISGLPHLLYGPAAATAHPLAYGRVALSVQPFLASSLTAFTTTFTPHAQRLASSCSLFD